MLIPINKLFESFGNEYYPRLKEDVADIAKERMFYIPQEFSDFEKKYAKQQVLNIKKDQVDRDVIISTKSFKKGIIKNPSSLRHICKNARGLIDPQGNLYLFINDEATHFSLIQELSDAGYIEFQDFWWMNIPKKFVTIERIWEENEFALGESNSILDSDYNFEGGGYKIKYKMPNIEEARKAYVLFIKAAEKVNPQYKFYPYLWDELIRAKNKTSKVNEGNSVMAKFYQDRFGIMPSDKPVELRSNYKIVTKVPSWNSKLPKTPIIINPPSLDGFDNKVRAIADKDGNLYVAMYNMPFNHGLMANALIDAKVINTDYYNKYASQIANVGGVYEDQENFLLLNRFYDEYVFVASDTFENFGPSTEKLIQTLKKKNPQFKYRFSYEDFGEIDESQKLFENPDVVNYPMYYDGNFTHFRKFIWADGENYAFGVFDGKLYISEKGNTHFNIVIKNPENNIVYNIERNSFKYPGRIWKDKKLISFWTYPDAQTFKKIIDELSKKLDVNIMGDPEWLVEIIRKKDTGEIQKGEMMHNSEFGEWDFMYTDNSDKFKISHIHPKDYIGSEDVPEEDRAKEHILSPLLKKKRKVPPGWGSNSDRYRRKRQWQMARVGDESKKEENFPRLFETPDFALQPNSSNSNDKLAWYEGTTFSFGLYDGKFYMSKEGKTHEDIIVSETPPKTRERLEFKYPGRIWIAEEYKLISFWTYPDVKTFKYMMTELSKNLKLKTDLMNDPRCYVEILKSADGEEIVKDTDFVEDNANGSWSSAFKYKGELVNPKDYVGSEDVPEEDRAKEHILSPLLKKKRKVPPGWGSNSDRYRRKRQWQMARVGDESIQQPHYPRLFERK